MDAEIQERRQKRRFIVLHERKVTCPSCKNHFRETPKLTLLGFQKFRCPQCGARVIYPLVQRTYYAIILIVLAMVVLLALAGYSNSPWGARLIALTVMGALYVLERVSYLLFPLAAWAVLRLVGMHYPSALPPARKILWWTGLIALIGILIGALGTVASLIWRGVILETLMVALVLGGFLLAILSRDRSIRSRVQKRDLNGIPL
jgi:predicted RNA-binding Zn-ribbon protein involved in translation (DUF1610 family)